MQNGCIKVIGRRRVYPVRKGWNEPLEAHRRDANGCENECQKQETPSTQTIPTQPSRMERD
jgi:hypothetical protein